MPTPLMKRFFAPALAIVAGLLTQAYLVVDRSLPVGWLPVGLAPYVVCSIVVGHVGKLRGLFSTAACVVTDLMVISSDWSGQTAVEAGLTTFALPLFEMFVAIPIGYALALVLEKRIANRPPR